MLNLSKSHSHFKILTIIGVIFSAVAFSIPGSTLFAAEIPLTQSSPALKSDAPVIQKKDVIQAKAGITETVTNTVPVQNQQLQNPVNTESPSVTDPVSDTAKLDASPPTVSTPSTPANSIVPRLLTIEELALSYELSQFIVQKGNNLTKKTNIPEITVKPQADATTTVVPAVNPTTPATTIPPITRSQKSTATIPVKNTIRKEIVTSLVNKPKFSLPSEFTQAVDSFLYPAKPLSKTATKRLYSLAGLFAVTGGVLLLDNPLNIRRRNTGFLSRWNTMTGNNQY